jgi:hypothetical protein
VILGVFQGIRVALVDGSGAHGGERLVAFEGARIGLSLTESELRAMVLLGEIGAKSVLADDASSLVPDGSMMKVLRPALDALEAAT